MQELTIIVRYDTDSIEAIGEHETSEAARFGWKMADMLSAFTLHAANKKRQSPVAEYILIHKNGETYWDVLRDGEGSLLGQDSAL
jgi:hypothetical protein